MSTTNKQIYGKEIQFLGKPGSPVKLSAPESSLELSGRINIVDSASAVPASISLNGVDLLDYEGTNTSYTTISSNDVPSDTSFIVASHPDSDGAIDLKLPLISTLTSGKKYRIQFTGDLRIGTREVVVIAHKDTADVTIGDFFDGIGAENSATNNWDHAERAYSVSGTIEIEAVVGGYTGGTTNGWRILSSHLHGYHLLKQPVRVCGVGNKTFPIYAGQTMDGVTLAKGDRIMLKNQSTGAQNGIYIVSADAQHPDVRSPDMQANTTYASGFEFRVTSGTKFGNTKWYIKNAHASDRVGVDALDFEKVAGLLSLSKPDATVGQLTNINTGVTVNFGAGKIQTQAMTIGTHAKETFTVTCSEVLATSIVMLTVQDYAGNGSISLMADNIADGSFDIIITNSSGTSLNAVAIFGFLMC